MSNLRCGLERSRAPTAVRLATMSFAYHNGLESLYARKADNEPTGAINVFNICRLSSKTRRLCGRLDESDAHSHNLRIQPFSIQNTLDHK